MSEIDATRNAANVQGIARPSPSSSLTRVFPAATAIAPAHRNSVIFATAWVTRCSAAPADREVIGQRRASTM